MVLLSLLAVGLLSLSTISLRASGNSSAMAEARANARLALVMAIGQLQKAAGPDTRVTADADLLAANTANAHWTGVWKTRPDEDLAAGEPGLAVVDHHASREYLNDSRVDRRGRPKPPEVQEWLVSGDVDPSTTPDDSWIPMVAAEDAADEVSVPPIELGDDHRMGWWIADENQKALVALPDRNSSDNPAASRLAAQDYDFETFTADGSSTPLVGHADIPASQLESVSSLGSTGLLPLEGKAEINRTLGSLGHHMTTHARGLFVDVKRSGLKQDLSTFLALGDIEATDDLPGLTENDVILPGSHHRMTSPRFGMLKGWADLADELDSESGPASIEPRAPATRHLEIPGSASGPVSDLVNVSKPAIQPVIVEASLGWDFSPYSVDGAPQEYMRGHIYPRLIMWNPFNVTLSAKRYVLMLSHPRYGSFTARGSRINSRGGRFYFDDLCGQPTESFLGFVTEPTELAPGETKVFTPSIDASGGSKLFDKAVAFDPSDYSSNVLTSEQIPGVENFYWNSTVPVPPETDTTRNVAYGFSADMNSFYATPGFSDEFIVCQVDGNSSSIDWGDVNGRGEDFPRVAHFLCQNWGLNRYHKWYGAEKNDHPSNNGTPFREFRPGARDIGSLDNRRPPRLWRRGVRMHWFDDEAEHTATGQKVPAGRYTVPWLASANLRGGLLHHGNWVNIPFASGWQFPGSSSHIYFRQPTDPQLFQSFFPPSPFGAPDDSLPSQATIYDIPRRETGIISMGQLQHAQLSYSSWHPSLVIGHSQSTMNSDLDATVIKDQVRNDSRWEGSKPWDFDALIQKGSGRDVHRGETLVYDLCFEANEALWDRFMLSSLPFNGQSATWDPEDPLPVGRYVLNSDASEWNVDRLRQALAGDASMAFHRAAEFLANDGAFNVNSTSVPAWQALLGSMRDLERPSLDGGESSGSHQLSRSALTAVPGTDAVNSVRQNELWNGFRTLSDSDLNTLATEIVEQVRDRGPFLSLSDFINRRLADDRTTSRSGAIDQAIADARVFNRALQRDGQTDLRDIGSVETAGHRPDNVLYGLPGYFTQGDVLTAIAPAITVRGDTFRIRTYGEAQRSNGSVARAWCEAIVRRTPNYVDPSDDAAKPAISHSRDVAAMGELSQVNLVFGRRFEIVSFRWLSPEEMKKS